MDDEVKKKVSLIDELMIEDISSLSINELEDNISNLEKIIDKYSKKIEEKNINSNYYKMHTLPPWHVNGSGKNVLHKCFLFSRNVNERDIAVTFL